MSKALLLGLSLSICLFLLELGLRVATPFPIDSPSANIIDDPLLGQKVDPALPDVDERGFRNPPGIENPSVVAIGDSHTYGYNVSSENSWPAQLARLLGVPVYNLGVGGYGMLQYHDLMPEALAMHPERVLVALYLANDLVNICGYVRLEHWKTKLAGSEAERRLQQSCRVLSRPDGSPLEAPPEREEDLSLARRTALGSALRHLVWMPLKSELSIRGWIGAADPRWLRIDDPRNGTLVSLTRLRIHAGYMDLTRREVTALVDFSKARLQAMRRRAEAAGASLGVMLVPTRERVLYAYLRDGGFELPAEFERLFEVEGAATRDFLAFFAEEGIEAVDLLPYLAARLEEGGVYPRREDGHPLALGYEAYARGAYEAFFGPSDASGSAPPQ